MLGQRDECADSFAKSNMTERTNRSGIASLKVIVRKHTKFSRIEQSYRFVAIAVELELFVIWSKESAEAVSAFATPTLLQRQPICMSKTSFLLQFTNVTRPLSAFNIRSRYLCYFIFDLFHFTMFVEMKRFEN